EASRSSSFDEPILLVSSLRLLDEHALKPEMRADCTAWVTTRLRFQRFIGAPNEKCHQRRRCSPRGRTAQSVRPAAARQTVKTVIQLPCFRIGTSQKQALTVAAGAEEAAVAAG